MNAARPIVIGCPSHKEAYPLSRRILQPHYDEIRGRAFWSGSLAKIPVVITSTGEGKSLAAAGTQLALDVMSPIAFITAGVAMALSPLCGKSSSVQGTSGTTEMRTACGTVANPDYRAG